MDFSYVVLPALIVLIGILTIWLSIRRGSLSKFEEQLRRRALVVLRKVFDSYNLGRNPKLIHYPGTCWLAYLDSSVMLSS
jgi:hypothetical protein